MFYLSPSLTTLSRPFSISLQVGAVGLAGGQVMDLQCEGKEGVTLQQLQWIHAHKTAALLKVRPRAPNLTRALNSALNPALSSVTTCYITCTRVVID